MRVLTGLLSVLLLSLATMAGAETLTYTTYYHNDHLGSPVAATDADGELLWRAHFRPYGERQEDPRDANFGTVGYTGHTQDKDSGLVYAGARYMDPMLGRFMAVDPVGFQTSNPLSFNRYAYGSNNPQKYVDPDGRVIETAWDVASIAMGVASTGANIAAGNYGKAAVDVVGVVVDTAAMLVPGVPGGAGAGIKAFRAADEVADVVTSANQIGRAGEDAVQAAYDIGSKQKFSINGRDRIPDGVTDTVLSEVKNVKSMSYTQQLRDFSDISSQKGLRFDLYVRPSTKLSSPLVRAVQDGRINLKVIPGAK